LKRFAQLCYWVREELPVKEAILDGEVVALDSEGRQNFRSLLTGRQTKRAPLLKEVVGKCPLPTR
jgi:ATP-dependent DNA ligase